MCSNIVLSLAPMAESIHDRICDMSQKYTIPMNEEFQSAVDNYLYEVKHLVFINILFLFLFYFSSNFLIILSY